MKREEISHNYYHTLEDNTVSEFIQYYNEFRPHRKLKNISPGQYEKSFFSTGQNIPGIQRGQIKTSNQTGLQSGQEAKLRIPKLAQATLTAE